MPTPITNDFKKAMSSIVLTASASLAEAQRLTSKMGSFNRRKADQTHGLAVEFCRLLIEPVNEHGPGFAGSASVVSDESEEGARQRVWVICAARAKRPTTA